ncbi:hypothetical protein Csa_015620, partial [Cucumis sativus]
MYGEVAEAENAKKWRFFRLNSDSYNRRQSAQVDTNSRGHPLPSPTLNCQRHQQQ